MGHSGATRGRGEEVHNISLSKSMCSLGEAWAMAAQAEAAHSCLRERPTEGGSPRTEPGSDEALKSGGMWEETASGQVSQHMPQTSKTSFRSTPPATMRRFSDEGGRQHQSACLEGSLITWLFSETVTVDFPLGL